MDGQIDPPDSPFDGLLPGEKPCADCGQAPARDPEGSGRFDQLCRDCYSAVPVCEVEGHSGDWAATREEFKAEVANPRHWSDAELTIGECVDCGTTLGYPDNDNPDYQAFIAERHRKLGVRAHYSSFDDDDAVGVAA